MTQPLRYPDYSPVVVQLDLNSELWKPLLSVMKDPKEWKAHLADCIWHSTSFLNNMDICQSSRSKLDMTVEQEFDYFTLRYIGSKAAETVSSFLMSSALSTQQDNLYLVLSGAIPEIRHILVSIHVVLYYLGYISESEFQKKHVAVVKEVLTELPVELPVTRSI